MRSVLVRKREKEQTRLLFGSFIEHIENCIDGGIVDPGNPLSDEKGIRLDVLEKCKELGPSVVRFPGGTVMGIYHWQDYVGPVEGRKKVRNIVWGGKLCREFGTAEYIDYCHKIGAEPMICVNMATGTAEEAANWVEYCNGTEDSHYANLRRSHGYEEPFQVKYWCIGNESYAKPDLGQQDDVKRYIRDAWEFVKYMKMTDPSIELVFVGNGDDPEWNREVLKEFAPVCDYLSVHFYAGGETAFDQLKAFETGKLVLLEKLLDEYNERDAKIDRWYRIPGRSHPIRLALDEWNIWNSKASAKSKYGLDQVYDWEDALWTAEFLIMLIEHKDHIGIANLAQMVNVIAPILADQKGSYRQPTFYPFSYFGRYCGEDACFFVNRGEENSLETGKKKGKLILLTDNTGADKDPSLSDCVKVTESLFEGESLTVPKNSIGIVI